MNVIVHESLPERSENLNVFSEEHDVKKPAITMTRAGYTHDTPGLSIRVNSRGRGLQITIVFRDEAVAQMTMAGAKPRPTRGGSQQSVRGLRRAW